MDILDSIDSKIFSRQDPSCSENCLKIENSIQWQCRITPRYLQEIKFNGKFNFSSSRLLPPSFFITFTSFSILFLGIIAQLGQLFYEVDFDITKSVISKDIFWHNFLKIRKSFNNVVQFQENLKDILWNSRRMELHVCNSINILATLRIVLLLLGYNLELGASQYLQEAPPFISVSLWFC